MDKEHIVSEIRRTADANGGIALGLRRFSEETGIGYYDWFGKYWSRWSDAVREAGLEPNQMVEAIDDRSLLEKLTALTQSLRRVPTQGDLMLARKADPTFPSLKTFQRLGLKRERAARMIEYCEANPGNDEVAALWRKVASRQQSVNARASEENDPRIGYVYLLKHGSRREYKIGRTNNPMRREGEVAIQLPERLKPVHYIKTDDPAGVENYWHTRFASKRKVGEWFELTAEDVRAFKRWKRIF